MTSQKDEVEILVKSSTFQRVRRRRLTSLDDQRDLRKKKKGLVNTEKTIL
jgi:hypothetical protein